MDNGGPSTRLRSRGKGESGKVDEVVTPPSGRKQPAPLARPLGYAHWLCLFGVAIALYLVAIALHNRLPTPQPSSRPEGFSEQRARLFLNELVATGPRPSGSRACEQAAFDVILGEVEKVRTDWLSAERRLDVDVQRPDGCYDLGFLSHFTLCYQNVTNVVVRLGDSQTKAAEHSLLLNCHFDSMPDSPGASDDAVSCALMLEIMRVLAREKQPMQYDVVFLFNGAEENFLQASHGFTTKHPWRHSIRAFINLEGAGAGGRELLFQAGPGNGWLIKTYLERAPYPHCSVVAQEIFESGLFPSDTDFRIFRDFGRVAGLDIAFVQNGYVYHSEFDLPEFITPGTIQRAGENVLETTRGLMESPYVARPADYQRGRWVFFDMIGLFIVSYPQNVGWWLNYIALVLLALQIYSNVRSADSYTLAAFGGAMACHLACFVVVFAVGMAMTRVMGLLRLTLVWYTRPSLIAVFYLIPCAIGAFAFHSLVAARLFSKVRPLAMERCYFDAAAGVWAVLLFLATWYDVASGVFALVHICFPLLRSVALRLVSFVNGHSEPCAVTVWACHVLVMWPLVPFGSYTIMFTLEVFIPTMGRSGQSIDPEIFVMVLAALGAYSFALYTSGFLFVSRDIGYILRAAGCFCAAMLALCLLTRLGVPYNYDPADPRLRRIFLFHSSNRHYAPDGALLTEKHGLWVVAMDFRGVMDLPDETFLQGAEEISCNDTPDHYCRLPYYVPIVFLYPVHETRWIPTPAKPNIAFPIELKLLNRQNLPGGHQNISLELSGCDHMTLHVTPLDGWALTGWSLADPVSGYRDTHFAFLAVGAHDHDKAVHWRVWFILSPDKKNKDKDGLAVELGVGSHYVHGEHQRSDALKRIVAQVEQRRRQPRAALGWWRWAITPVAGNTEFVSRQF